MSLWLSCALLRQQKGRSQTAGSTAGAESWHGYWQASMHMEAMGFKGAIQVGMGLLDRFRVRGARAAMPPNPIISLPLTQPNQVPIIGSQVS